MKFGFVVPVYNHGKALENVASSLVKYSVPIIVVDDGNDEENKSAILQVANAHGEVVLIVREKNGGKGAAVNDGVRKAAALGLTHVFQVDSDGQHDVSSVPLFLEKAEEFPNDIICGFPEYDESVPASRKSGREISNNWARICTLDKSIVDVLCGFRIYPVEPYMKLLRKPHVLNERMGFDVDILVHLMWAGVGLRSCGVRVTYPKDGFSNFHMVRDNIAISLTFTRLFFGMVFRLPILLMRKRKAERQK